MVTSVRLAVFVFCLGFGFGWNAVNASELDLIQIEDMELAVPEGWVLSQDAKDQGTIILGFKYGDDYLNLYVKAGVGLDMHDLFVNGSSVVRDTFDYPRAGFNWKVIQTSRTSEGSVASTYVSGFKTELNGNTYFGYSRASSTSDSMAIVNTFLNHIR